MSSPPPSSDISQPTAGRALFALVLIGLGAAAVYFYQDSRRGLPESVAQVQKENEELRRQLLEFRDRQAELDAEELMDLESKQLLQARVLELSATGTLAARQVDVFAAEVAMWQKLAANLETSDEGRRIAADPSVATQYLALSREERPRPERAGDLKARLETLRVPIEAALKAENAVYTPAAGLEQEIEAIAEEARHGAEVYRKQTARLKGILAAAPTTAPPEVPGLRVAVAALERQWADAENRRVTEALAEVQEEEAEKLARLKAEEARKLARQKAENERRIAAAAQEAERQAAEIELQRLRDEQEEAAKQEQMRVAEREARLQKETLLAEFERDLPQIRKYLAAFLAEGYTQPDERGQLRPTSTKGPISLSGLQSAGALNETIRGMTRLNIIATYNDERPTGGFPAYYGDVIGESSIPYVQTAQKYLIKYGDILVEKGMLQP